MKSGIYFSSDPNKAIFKKLGEVFRVSTVARIDQLRKKLFTEEYDFLYLDIEDTTEALQVFQVAYDLDPEIITITHMQHALPEMSGFYIVEPDELIANMIEVLSFNDAKNEGVLQATYDPDFVSNPMPFYLTDLAPFGVILTDAEENIIYVNESAKNLLNYDEEKCLLRHYFRLDHSLEEYLEPDENLDRRHYKSVPVIDSDIHIGIQLQDVMVEGKKQGSVYYLEDIAEKHVYATRLLEQKEKYERLTARLNDVLLKDLGSNAYNFSYLKRKLDLEIKHAHKMNSDVGVLYFGIPDFEKLIRDVAMRKTIMSCAISFLIEKFPEPHIVGNLDWGHWLVIMQGEALGLPKDARILSEQLRDYLVLVLGGRSFDIRFLQFADLKRFSDTTRFMEVLFENAV